LDLNLTVFNDKTEEFPPIPAIQFELDSFNLSADQPLGRILNPVGGNIVLKDKEFTIERLQEDRKQNIVHLITHARFYPREKKINRAGDNNRSFIYFRDSRNPVNEGNLLRLPNISNADLERNPSVELIFLSACQTAVGDYSNSAELGFAGSFVQAKVKSVIASLWKVKYRETFVLSMEFYHQLRKGGQKEENTKAHALKRAQKAMMDGSVYIENMKLYLSGQEEGIQLPENFPELDIEAKYEFRQPGDWAGLTLVGSPW
jgi:CHAT domain-containing protein